LSWFFSRVHLISTLSESFAVAPRRAFTTKGGYAGIRFPPRHTKATARASCPPVSPVPAQVQEDAPATRQLTAKMDMDRRLWLIRERYYM
jgi:hypothetical protein